VLQAHRLLDIRVVLAPGNLLLSPGRVVCQSIDHHAINWGVKPNDALQFLQQKFGVLVHGGEAGHVNGYSGPTCPVATAAVRVSFRVGLGGVVHVPGLSTED
jgi:hypothetical protein